MASSSYKCALRYFWYSAKNLFLSNTRYKKCTSSLLGANTDATWLSWPIQINPIWARTYEWSAAQSMSFTSILMPLAGFVKVQLLPFFESVMSIGSPSLPTTEAA